MAIGVEMKSGAFTRQNYFTEAFTKKKKISLKLHDFIGKVKN